MADTRRDRGGTQQKIIDAAYDLLAKNHDALPGINAIARAAGCDKQLIYRYFDGVEGVFAAVGEVAALRFATALMAYMPPTPTSYAALVQALLAGLIAVYRSDPSLAGIKRSELQFGPALGGMGATRAKVLSDWMAPHLAKVNMPPAEGVDRGAINALFIGAVESAILASYSSGTFAGMSLMGDADWNRLQASLQQLVLAIYGPKAAL